MRLIDMRFLRRSAVALTLAMTLPLAALAQRAAPGPGNTFKDTSMFKPPAGAKVAVLEFEDLECPACAHAFPVVHAAAARYNIPLLRKDYPLGGAHIWSGDAAIWARYIQDKVSPKTGDEYRGAVFAAQQGIASKEDLLAFTRQFFQKHGLQMPFVPDSTGQLAAEVKVDHSLGEKMGLTQTPTIIVCNQHEWVQVTNVDTSLYQTIEQLQASAGSTASVKSPVKAKPLRPKKNAN